MDIRKVKKLIELLEESNIAELEIHEGEESVRISRHGSGAVVAAPVAAPCCASRCTRHACTCRNRCWRGSGNQRSQSHFADGR